MLSITFQNTVLTAQKVLMVDESQSLTQQTPHNKHHCQTNKFFFTVHVGTICTHVYRLYIAYTLVRKLNTTIEFSTLSNDIVHF